MLKRKRDTCPIDDETIRDIAAAAFDFIMESEHPVPCHVMKDVTRLRLSQKVNALNITQRTWLGQRAGRYRSS